jgi:NADH:ubiquinone oxidoreductase subunit 3 (subunit A)
MTNNKQQTAVEYLIYHIRQDVFVHSKSTKEWNQVFQQAKEMEKEQILDAYECGFESEHDARIPQFSMIYYNETYGKNHIGDVNKMVGGEQ